jgi:hypothetical protein
MNLRAFFSRRLLYWAWTLLSAIGLIGSAYVDPYVLGFFAFATAIISGLAVLGAVILSRRNLVWAVISVAPTAVAFLVLSTYNWA